VPIGPSGSPLEIEIDDLAFVFVMRVAVAWLRARPHFIFVTRKQAAFVLQFMQAPNGSGKPPNAGFVLQAGILYAPLFPYRRRQRTSPARRGALRPDEPSFAWLLGAELRLGTPLQVE
jgi:hypothetical protein